MREMKPLILPKLVAARKSSKSSLDMSPEPTSSSHSYTDSGFYSASECSTPPTPNIAAARGHLRFPSSASSLSSSPPAHDAVEIPNGSGKLPKLTEEPVEREDDYVTEGPYRCSCDIEFCGHARLPTRRSIFGQAYDFAEDYFTNESESHMFKRRRSGEAAAQSITNKLETRFPSLSRKMRERKGSVTFGGRTSRSATPSRVPSSRSSSITSSIRQRHDLGEKLPSSPARVSKERLEESHLPAPIDIAKANKLDTDAEQADVERFATTPLLPPLLVKNRLEELPTQSPLQSPTVADASQSTAATPVGTPPVPAYPTPPLSTKASIASFKASRTGLARPPSDLADTDIPPIEIPPMMLADPNDKWADKLGHANFTIQPEPYLPDICDAASLRLLFADWEQARCNYTKHQVRTAEHFGVTSKTYRFTEEKWAEIDDLWRKNNDLAVSRAAAMGAEPGRLSLVEPAPLSKMPNLNDPNSEGKFPKLGDEDIVGPMIQIAAQVQKQPPRKRAFFKFLQDMKFPGSIFGRSSTTVRAAR